MPASLACLPADASSCRSRRAAVGALRLAPSNAQCDTRLRDFGEYELKVQHSYVAATLSGAFSLLALPVHKYK
jgi:hypothetical protein